VCGAGRARPSAREMTTGQGFPSPKRPGKGADRDLKYQFRGSASV